MAARKLRAVGEGETKPEPKTLLEAVSQGDYLAELKFTHERIAKQVADQRTSPRDLAALTRRQLEISKEIRALELARKQEGMGANPSADEAFDASAI